VDVDVDVHGDWDWDGDGDEDGVDADADADADGSSWSEQLLDVVPTSISTLYSMIYLFLWRGKRRQSEKR
jgi:hypothetical protein